MGAGASKDGEEIEVDDRYVSQSQSGSASGPISPRPRSERKSVGQVRKPSRMSMSRSTDGDIPVVAVMKNGFSVPEVTIMEGQAVVFVWQEDRMDVVQVIHDGEKLRPVIGGFSGSYSNSNGQYEQQFNLEGEYKFALSGIRCTPLLVTVRRRVDLVAEVTDTGFQPDIIYIDQGHSIKWQWRDCNSPHSIQEVKYDMMKACFKKDSDSAGEEKPEPISRKQRIMAKYMDQTETSTVKTVSGNYRHQFLRPGLYFFMTEGAELGRRHFCAVHVRDTNREFRVEIQDRSYQPMILLIEEGDRVWWSWDKQKCKKHHSVYQIEAPALNQGDDDPYVPVKDGFRWTTPSKQGLMSYEFFKPGVYYYSDQNFQEAAEYIGTIIVKPKQKDLFVELTESGFNPDLVYAQTGDRIWWTWDGQACVNAKKPQLFALMETEACLNPASRKSSAKEGEEVYQYLDDESLALVTKVGLATTHFSTIGVYHYRVAESPDTLNTCSVIVNPGPKNHTIHLTDMGFEPKVITVRPNDRVWWVWQSGRKQHNILQVSHQGVPIENGFCSGSFRDAPSAFVHQFMTPGVFYFLSHSLPKLFGAIVVSTQPQVHEVNVGVDIKPDPVAVKMNDIVCWIFRSLRQYGVSRVQSIDQIAGNEVEEVTVPPRRCMSKSITRSGVQHFYSRSFTKGRKEKENFIDDIKISSVVCDERYDNAVVRIDKNGFHPAVYYIQKSQSVMWVWKGSEDEAHNVIHVKSPDSDEPLNVIHGAKSFNSGKPVPNNSFLYTFDEDGSYTVASQGAPGFFCTIVVLDVGMRVKEPFLDSSVTGGTVDAGTKVLLSCETPGSRIYYTTDGSPPELHQESVKLYRPENGVIIRRPGLQFIRAMATKEGRLNSHIYTSNRFWVMGDGDDRSMSSELSAREAKQVQRTSAKTWDWWGCIPAIKACFTNPGTLEVFWDPPESGHLSLIKGYQLFLNGVSYCDMFPPTNNSLRVSGMAGGRTYDVLVEVYSKKPDCQAQKSNKLRMKCPLVTSDSGPVISLERNDKTDTLAIVWMSIDTPQNPISGYLVFLNDQQCGKRLVPDPESNRCKVVIGSCETEKPYKVYVVAIPADSEDVLMSNVLEVVLPLDTHEIRLPPRDSRSGEEELYLEYLEVNEGSGYLPAMDNMPQVYTDRRDHSFITESPDHKSDHRMSPTPRLSPKRGGAPILPAPSRPPPVIYDALIGDEVKRRTTQDSIDVEEARYKDGVSPLRKESAKFRSKSFEEDESGRQSCDRISSGLSSLIAQQRSRSHSPTPTPRQDTNAAGRIGFRALGQAVRLGALGGQKGPSFKAVGHVARVGAPGGQKVPKLDLTEHKKSRALTFKTVCKAIIGFIRQEKILRTAVGRVNLQKPDRFDLKRLKNYITRTKAFTDALSKTKDIEIIAPGAKKGTGMAGLFAAASAAVKTVQQVKALGRKKSGFITQGMEQRALEPKQQTAATPGTSIDTPGPSGRHPRDEGYASNQEYERDRRFPPDYRYHDGYPRDPRDRPYRDYPYHDRYPPPWEMGYRDEYEDYYRRERDQGYDTMRSRERRAFEDYYRREMDYDRNREYYRRKLTEFDQAETPEDYSKVPHGERYKIPPQDYGESRRRSSMRSPDGYPRDRSYSPAEDKSLRFQDSSPEDTQRFRRDRRSMDESDRVEFRNQRDNGRYHRSPEEYRRNEMKERSDRRKSSPGDDTARDNLKTPEEYRWGRGKEGRKKTPKGPGPRYRDPLQYSRSFDRGYRGEYRRYRDPREEEAKMRAIAVYANAMGGVNDEGGKEQLLASYEDDQSVMTDDNEKSTQTSSTPQKHCFKPQLSHDFIPPSLQEKGVSPRGRRRPAPDSESETETETETEIESEGEDALGTSRSMVVMDAQKPQAPHLAVRKQRKTPRTPRSGREFETPRGRGVSLIRDGREYIEVEDDGTTESMDEPLPPHPQEMSSFDKPRKKRRHMAIIEVQDAVELDAKRNETSMEEERQVAVPAVTKESMRQIDEGQFITTDGEGILPAPSIMVESHGKSGVRVVWDLPREPDPEYHLLLYVVNVVGTRFTGDINSDISFECNIVEKGKQVRGVQHCWNIQDKNRCTISGLVPGLTYRLYVIANYTLVHGQQPCEIQTTSSVIYYTTVGPPRPPKLRVVSVDMHQALLEWEPPRLHEDLQLKGYQIYVDNKPLGSIRNKETRQMMINNLVPGKTLSAYVVAVTKQANQESEPSRVIHITCPREPPPITVAQQPAYKQGCVLISWDRPTGHTYATNEEDISLYGHKAAGTKDTNRFGGKGSDKGSSHRKGDNIKTADRKNIPRQTALQADDKNEAIEVESKDIEGHGYKRIRDKSGDRHGDIINQHEEFYGKDIPRQIATHMNGDAVLKDGKGYVDGHGYKRTRNDRQAGFKGGPEHKRYKHGKRMKGKYTDGDSSGSSSSSWSETSSESDSDYSREHYVDDDNDYRNRHKKGRDHDIREYKDTHPGGFKEKKEHYYQTGLRGIERDIHMRHGDDRHLHEHRGKYSNNMGDRDTDQSGRYIDESGRYIDNSGRYRERGYRDGKGHDHYLRSKSLDEGMHSRRSKYRSGKIDRDSDRDDLRYRSNSASSGSSTESYSDYDRDDIAGDRQTEQRRRHHETGDRRMYDGHGRQYIDKGDGRLVSDRLDRKHDDQFDHYDRSRHHGKEKRFDRKQYRYGDENKDLRGEHDHDRSYSDSDVRHTKEGMRKRKLGTSEDADYMRDAEVTKGFEKSENATKLDKTGLHGVKNQYGSSGGRSSPDTYTVSYRVLEQPDKPDRRMDGTDTLPGDSLKHNLPDSKDRSKAIEVGHKDIKGHGYRQSKLGSREDDRFYGEKGSDKEQRRKKTLHGEDGQEPMRVRGKDVKGHGYRQSDSKEVYDDGYYDGSVNENIQRQRALYRDDNQEVVVEGGKEIIGHGYRRPRPGTKDVSDDRLYDGSENENVPSQRALYRDDSQEHIFVGGKEIKGHGYRRPRPGSKEVQDDRFYGGNENDNIQSQRALYSDDSQEAEVVGGKEIKGHGYRRPRPGTKDVSDDRLYDSSENENVPSQRAIYRDDSQEPIVVGGKEIKGHGYRRLSPGTKDGSDDRLYDGSENENVPSQRALYSDDRQEAKVVGGKEIRGHGYRQPRPGSKEVQDDRFYGGSENENVQNQRALYRDDSQEPIVVGGKEIKGHGYRQPRPGSKEVQDDRFYGGNENENIPSQRALYSDDSQEAKVVGGKEIRGHGYRQPRPGSKEVEDDRFYGGSENENVQNQRALYRDYSQKPIVVGGKEIKGHGYRQPRPGSKDVQDDRFYGGGENENVQNQRALYRDDSQEAIVVGGKEIKGHGYRRPRPGSKDVSDDRFYDGSENENIPSQRALYSDDSQEAKVVGGKEIRGYGYRRPRPGSKDEHEDRGSSDITQIPRQVATQMNGDEEVIVDSDGSVEGHGYRRRPKGYTEGDKKGSGSDGTGRVSKVVDGKLVSGHGYKRGPDGKKIKKEDSKPKTGIKGSKGKVKESKGKKKRDKKAVKGNILKSSSSESETSSSSSSSSTSEKSSRSSSEKSSDSETDDSREEIRDDANRKYIIEVEPERGDEFRRKSSEPDIRPRNQYYGDYIRGRRPDLSDPLRRSTSDKKAWPEAKDSDGRKDKTAFENDRDTQKIRDFRNDNLEDIGELINYIKSINRYGPRSRRQKYLSKGKPPLLRREKLRTGNLKGGLKGFGHKTSTQKQTLPGGQMYMNQKERKDGQPLNRDRDKKPTGGRKRDSDHANFLEGVIDTNSEDSRQRQMGDTKKRGQGKKGAVGKLPPAAGKFKSPYAVTTGVGKGKTSDKTGADFRGSRINAVKRGVTPSHSDARSKEIKRNMDDEDKENKRVYFALINNDENEPKNLSQFRGISSGELGGKMIDTTGNNSADVKNGSGLGGISADNKDGTKLHGKHGDLKGKSTAQLKDISNLENKDGRVYVDGKWYGEVKSNKLGNKHGYQYILNDLNPEQSYDINVKAIAGYKRVDPDAQHVFCLSDGPLSNTVPVMAPAAPKSPKLRLEGLHPEGIDVTWLAPQQHGEAAISGYQMLRNGKLYGSIIPPEVNSLRIRDVSLGEKVTLQLIALTEHPVGKIDRRTELLEKDSGIDGSSPGEKDAEVFIGEKYAGCRPGAKLVVHYTGLVCPPSQVWCERVTGHSALIVWNKDDEPRAHFIRPESYQVTWWPGDHPEDDIQSDSTTEDHLLITNLRRATTYTVVVEARKMEKYKDVDEADSVGHETISAFILTAKSDNLIVKTARPPDAPSNLGALATTCSAIKLAWDPPREHGVDIIGIRVDAVSLNTGDPHHVSLDVIPDATVAVIEALREKTDYMIRVTAITDEFFDRLPDAHRFRKTRTIPKDTILPADDSIWLPNCSILTKTSGTEPPAAIKVAKASTTSLKLVWTPPIVYGSNKLQSVIVRWADVKYNKRKDDDDLVIASHVNLLPTEDTLLIEDLMPGNQYKIIVEAVVSVKTSLEKDDSASGIEKYRRTAHIMSRPLYARTRAPTEPPILLITGYTQTTAQLYWEKPLLMSVVGKDAEGKPKYLRRYLEGYRLEINGKTYCHLGPASQSCQLTKCKPGKLYHVTLVALTCTEQGKKERKRKYKGAYKNTNPQDMDYSLLLEDDNLDSSPSEPLEITLPKNQDGYISTLDSFFTHNEDRDNKTFGDVKVQWTSQGPESALIKQHNIIWYSHDDRVVQTKYVSPDFSKCSIPVTRLKSTYDVVVEPAYFTETLPQQPQNIQIMIPGPPDPPEIFLKSQSPEEFVIEWGEPRLYGGVRVRGYQVYLNDKKAGNELSSTHRKAVVPCRPNRYYKVNLVALSANPEYNDSGKSNTLSINTSLTSPREGEALDELTYVDDHEVPVKVTKVTETSIHLDWANFLETDGVGCYKIQWSSVAQPAEREVRLSSKDSNCVINKCLPGTTHFVRLLALDEDGQIKERSKQMTVQTSAPPDGPTLSLRACNFRYIAVQWDKPNTYGDALITGYKVYLNGIVEAILNADQLSYTYTHGKWCQEYSFQVQALTSFEKMNSKPSEPLVVEWPGAKPPVIHRLPTHTSSNLRVGWDDPYLTEGVKLKHFRVCCIEEDTEKMVSSIGPVHPDTREAEFKQIKKGSYNVYVEVHLYGTSEVVCSDPIKLQPAPAPDAPRIAATVVGFDERRMLEKITCDLVNKRDRLIRQVGHKLKQIGALTHPLRAEKDRDVIEGAHMLTRVEELLEDCFSALENFTGQLMAHVSWQCEQSNPDIRVSGYKVLIDGKQYGNTMHEGIKTVRIKLGTEQQVFRLSMVSLTDKPSAASEESNVIDLLSETFRCFSFYCYHSIHVKGVCWPDQGCCKYQDSIAYERQLAKKLANQGLLKKHVPPPSCSLLDIFEGEYKPLLQSHNRQYPTVILFWTPWCLPSQKIMTYFTRFARETTKEYNFVAVACGLTGSTAADRKSLIHLITSNSWREDGTICHYTSQCASSIYEATNHIWKNTTGGIKRDPDIETESNVDLTDLLGIAGVPTFLFIHQEGYIAWHGRYSAYDYGSYAAFMRHTFSEVAAVPCPVFKCDSCKNDTSVDDETVDTILQFTNNQSPFKNTTIRPSVIRPPSPKEEDEIEKIFVKRKHSPKRKKNKLTVNQRPYSAHTTTYAYLLKSPYMERLTPSPKTHKVLMRPASSRNVQVAYETL